ncbi:MAG: nucleoside triphosphate pyrophosphohydrolase [Lawsonibacter sp.]
MVDFQYMNRYGINDLLRIMEVLRGPGGCPWDREQTHQSIRRNMLEEAYEVAEAIDEEDPAHLKEELGDVLLQVVFHARMAEERGLFSFDDVVDGICQKLVFRHPHVFGTVDAQDSDTALVTWEAQKREEKGQETAGDTLDAVARSLPALMRAEKIQQKAQKAGFDWDAVGPVLDKISEETQELRQAVLDQSNVEEELGDLLFVTVKAGRFLGLDSELALHAACEKFIRRFRLVESLADKPLTDLDVPALEALWRQAKAREHETNL